MEAQRKKNESTPLPQIHNSIGPGITKTATKGGLSNSSMIPSDSGTHRSVTPDAMTWANTWEMMNKHLWQMFVFLGTQAIATRNTQLM